MSQFGTGSASPVACHPCGELGTENQELHWIEIELVYEHNGEPVPGEAYCVKLPDGSERHGVLNNEGLAHEGNIPDVGQCDITFPRLDKNIWK